MKNLNLIFNGYMPFYNNSNSNILNKLYYEKNKDNNKQSQNINLFKKNYKSKIPIIKNITPKKQYEQDKNHKYENIDKNYLPSCPNIKDKNNLYNRISYNSNNINFLKSKILEYKNKEHYVLKPLQNININSFYSKINKDNNKLIKKDRDVQLDKIKLLMKQKEDRTFHNSLPKNINDNYSLNSDRLSNCLTVFSIKEQPIFENKNNNNTINKTIENRNKVVNKLSLKKKNIKIISLPKMNQSNNIIINNKKNIPKIKETFLNDFEKKSKTHIEEIKSFLLPIDKKKNKFKNLVSFDAYSLPGTDKRMQRINQDSYLVMPNINDTKNCKIFGVFDGHGDKSDILSQEIRDYFIEYFSNKDIYNTKKILNNFNKNDLEVVNRKISIDEKLEKIYNLFSENNHEELIKLYEKINNKLHEKYKEDEFCSTTGSTSSQIIVMNDKKKDGLNKIISINLGDSKSILIDEKNNVIDLNICHIPEEITEKERIEKNGGEISRVDWADYGPLRVFFKGKNYPGLALTRSFGDFNCESLGINSIPDIREYDIGERKPKILVLATDGIWQFLSNEKVKNILLPYYEENNVNGATQKLVKYALRMWEAKNPDYIDDITVIVLFFR